MNGLRPGEIVLEHASRAFSVRADRGRTLKEILIGKRRAGGPPPVQALRDVIYGGVWPSGGTIAYVLGAAVLAGVGGWAVFRRLERELAVVV
jgi:hypothetical protein